MIFLEDRSFATRQRAEQAQKSEVSKKELRLEHSEASAMSDGIEPDWAEDRTGFFGFSAVEVSCSS